MCLVSYGESYSSPKLETYFSSPTGVMRQAVEKDFGVLQLKWKAECTVYQCYEVWQNKEKEKDAPKTCPLLLANIRSNVYLFC